MIDKKVPGADRVDPVEPDDPGSFLSRWSRRKARANHPREDAETVDRGSANRLDSAGPVAPAGPPAVGLDAAAEPPAASPAEPPAEPELPDIDSLDADSDYSAFLSPRVSEALQRKALRKLFLSEAFNVRDGLNDYDDDYTTFEPLGDIVTADMKHQAEVERMRELARREAEDQDPRPDPDEETDPTLAEADDSAEATTADPAAAESEGESLAAGDPATDPATADAGRVAPGRSGQDDTTERTG